MAVNINYVVDHSITVPDEGIVLVDNQLYVKRKGADLSPLVNSATASINPYKCAFWGDSRNNGFSAASVETSGASSSFTITRTPMWVIAHMQDADYTYAFAVSGDTAALWNSASRTAGKTFTALNNSDADVVFIQYGVNDCSALTASATTIANLQNLIKEILKSGKYVVFDSISPINSLYSGSYVAIQALIEAVNAGMKTWIANFPGQAIYVDTASLFKDANGYADQNSGYTSSDGIHPLKLGCYYQGKALAAAARTLLPKKSGFFIGKNNYLNLSSPSPITTQFRAVDVGSVSSSQTVGEDSKGTYYEWILTPTAVDVNSEWRVRMEAAINFQTANPPFQTLLGNEQLQGTARVIIDNGSGGSPLNLYGLMVRNNFSTSGGFTDWGGTTIPSLDLVDYNEVIDIRVVTPRLNNATASIVATPATGTGFILRLFVEGRAAGGTVRVRMYNPQVLRTKYIPTVLTAASFAIPASTIAYTNNSLGNQQVIVGGGTVTVLAFNGTTTGLTNGSFILAPGDTLTPTYTIAPTWTVKQI
jgi:lysophospholipase L1-like esterase